eukprot:Nk52_evm66s78 gene=Nk52_evmTU66s78
MVAAKKKKNGELSKKERERLEIEALNEKCKALVTGTDYSSVGDPSSEVASGNQAQEYEKFSDLPLSEKTLKGLNDAGFDKMTDVQKDSIPRGLRGDDVLGAAKTGSGKTLAFLIPVIEKMYRERWTAADGVGALIISPTRELAYQIFEVLRKVGKYHDISAGLVIGGKDLKQEQERVNKMNIIICTPGRLLQHMDETAGFECPDLEVLVLDEADRILDMGFKKCINSIIENLPQKRQTLLFSATQTKSVKDLARLSLKDAEYVSVHENAKFATPTKLLQSYVEVDLDKKIDVLWSFVKNHLKTKTLVFLSSCKQVRFVSECFRKLRPGVPVMAMYGKQNQAKRMAIYDDFSRKEFALMFCTDIAARGLDFPAVNWVIQFDCPEDVDTYLHRVGRTARFQANGHGLLFLIPSEVPGMSKELASRKVPIKPIKINPKKNYTITGKLQAFCAEDPDMKYLAQKCFISYMRSVYLKSNKEVFDIQKLPGEKFAVALGLPNAPRIRFVKKKKEKIMGPSPDDVAAANDIQSKESGERAEKEPLVDVKKQQEQPKTYLDKLMSRSGNEANVERLKKIIDADNDEDSEDDFLQIKKADHDIDVDDDWEAEDMSKKKKKLLTSKVKISKTAAISGHKMKFDDEGNAVAIEEEGSKLAGVDIETSEREKIETDGIDLKASEAMLRKSDREDKKRQKDRLKDLKIKEKEKIKAMRMEAMGETGVQLDIPEAGEGEYEYSSNDNESDQEDVERKYRSESGEESGSSESEDEEEISGRKRKQYENYENNSLTSKKPKVEDIADDEAMALQLLGGH